MWSIFLVKQSRGGLRDTISSHQFSCFSFPSEFCFCLFIGHSWDLNHFGAKQPDIEIQCSPELPMSVGLHFKAWPHVRPLDGRILRDFGPGQIARPIFVWEPIWGQEFGHIFEPRPRGGRLAGEYSKDLATFSFAGGQFCICISSRGRISGRSASERPFGERAFVELAIFEIPDFKSTNLAIFAWDPSRRIYICVSHPRLRQPRCQILYEAARQAKLLNFQILSANHSELPNLYVRKPLATSCQICIEGRVKDSVWKIQEHRKEGSVGVLSQRGRGRYRVGSKTTPL